MRQIRTIFTALLLAAVIVFAVSKQEKTSWRLPEDVLAKENTIQQQEAQIIQGFPEEIEGVWEVSKSDGSLQTLTLYGSQLTVYSEVNGRIYYDNIVTQIQNNTPLLASPNASKEYSLVWDINAFIERYGESNLPEDQSPFILNYDETKDQLATSSTLVYRRNEEAELIRRLETQLVEQLPINRLQLAEINPQVLLDLWEAAQLEGLSGESVGLFLYKGLQAQYPKLSLLALDDIDAYQNLSEALMKRSGLTYEEVNQAGPSDVLAAFEEAKKSRQAEIGDDASKTPLLPIVLETIEEELTQLRAEYQQAVTEKEKQAALIGVE